MLLVSPSFRYNAGLIRATKTPFFTQTGALTSGTLTDRHGNAISSAKLKKLTAIYQTDWQGTNNLLYPTARTNLLANSRCATMGGFGTTPPTVTQNVSAFGQTVSQGVFASGLSGYNTTRMTGEAATGGSHVSIASGTNYAWSLWLALSRALTGSESIFVYFTGNQGTPWISIAAGNSAQYVGALKKISNTFACTITGNDFPAVYVSSALSSSLTVSICNAEFEAGSTAGVFIPTTTGPATVTDYTATGPSIAFGQMPASGATCSWTGIALR